MAGNIFQIKQINNLQTINANRWSLRFPELNYKLLTKAKSAVSLPGIQERYRACQLALGDDPSTSLELSLSSVSLPAVTLETAPIPKFNDQIKAVTKFTEIGDMSITFIDYVNGSASAIMQLWHAFVGDKKTGAIGFKQDFVLSKAYFFVYGPDAPGYEVETSTDIPYLQKYEIINIFPKVVNLGEHGEGAEPRKVTVDFAIDNIYPVEIRTYNYEAQTPQERYNIPTL